MHRLLIFVLLFVAPSLHAQPLIYEVDYRPAGARFFVLESPHFDIIYQEGTRSEAAELAHVLEENLDSAAVVVGHRGELRMPVVLRGYEDRANGFVSITPFRQEIDAVSIKSPELAGQHASWIEAVGVHELVHALHADARPGGGIGTIIRPFAPDQARAINLGGPSGVNEGVAVWYESNMREGAGRLNNPFFSMKYRAAMVEEPWSLAQMLEPSAYSLPDDRHYVGGGIYAEYLSERDDLESFRRSRRAFYRFPFLGYGLNMWWGNRESPFTTGSRIRNAVREAEAERTASQGPFDEPTIVISETGTVHSSPLWLDNSTIVVHARGYAVRPGFYTVSAQTGERELLSHQTLADEQHFDLDRESGRLVFSRFVRDLLPTGASKADAFQVDVNTGNSQRLTRDARIHAPAFEDDGQILALENRGQFSRLVRIAGGGVPVAVLEEERVLFRQIDPRPGTDQVMALASVEDHQGVLLIEPGRLSPLAVSPYLFLEDMPIYDISWSEDGRYLLFTAARDGVANIFAYDAENESVHQLTNARFGAMDASLSPDASTLAFVHYRHERYELATQPFEPGSPLAIEQISPREDWRTVPAVPDSFATRPYRASSYLEPRLFSPVVLADDDVTGDEIGLGFGIGVSAEGVDPLKRWAYGGQVYYRNKSAWGSTGVSYGGFAFTPTLRLYREPSTVLRRFPTGVTRRVGREQRGVGLSASLPLTLKSNVFTSTAGLALGIDLHQDRLFDADNQTIDQFRSIVTARPSGFITYGVQMNRRDLLPNTGIILTGASRYDVWDEWEVPMRSVTSRLYAYAPLLRAINGSVRFDGGILSQSAREGVNTELFRPRGFRNRYLGRGTFLRAGVEIVQPLVYVENGSILLPVYIQALYGFGAAEGLRAISGTDDEFGSLTAGVGARLRLFHHNEVDLRWGITIRSDNEIRQSWR